MGIALHKGTLADIVDGGYGTGYGSGYGSGGYGDGGDGYGGYGYGGYGGYGYGDGYGAEIKPTEWIEILTEGELN